MVEGHPIKNSGAKFAAFVARYPDVAVVSVYRRLPGYNLDFSQAVSEYETSSAGATASARREIARLEAEAA